MYVNACGFLPSGRCLSSHTVLQSFIISIGKKVSASKLPSTRVRYIRSTIPAWSACRYICPPPVMNGSSGYSSAEALNTTAFSSACSSETAQAQFSTFPIEFKKSASRDTTRLVRPGNALPIDSNVRRPITIGCPHVRFLKYFKSPGRCHRSSFPSPISPLGPAATASDIFFTAPVIPPPFLLYEDEGRNLRA